MGLKQRLPDASALLLAVVFQDLIAGQGQPGTVFLKARQNGEIALIHQGAAKTLDVAGARLLLFRRAAALLLGKGAGRNRYRQQRKRKENVSHDGLSF